MHVPSRGTGLERGTARVERGRGSPLTEEERTQRHFGLSGMGLKPEVVAKLDEAVIEDIGKKVKVSMPLCARTDTELRCTGKFEATYEKGVVGPQEVHITYPV